MALSTNHGQPASDIPERGRVRPDPFGIALSPRDGQVLRAGEATTPFSIQSISKVFTLAVAPGRASITVWPRQPAGRFLAEGWRLHSHLRLNHQHSAPQGGAGDELPHLPLILPISPATRCRHPGKSQAHSPKSKAPSASAPSLRCRSCCDRATRPCHRHRCHCLGLSCPR